MFRFCFSYIGYWTNLSCCICGEVLNVLVISYPMDLLLIWTLVFCTCTGRLLNLTLSFKIHIAFCNICICFINNIIISLSMINFKSWTFLRNETMYFVSNFLEHKYILELTTEWTKQYGHMPIHRQKYSYDFHKNWANKLFERLTVKFWWIQPSHEMHVNCLHAIWC